MLTHPTPPLRTGPRSSHCTIYWPGRRGQTSAGGWGEERKPEPPTNELSASRSRSRNGGFWSGGWLNWAEMESRCRFWLPPNDYLMSEDGKDATKPEYL